MNPLSNEHYQELQQAKTVLENPSLAARISNVLGSPIEKGLALLPSEVNRTIVSVTTKSLNKALDVAIFTLDKHHGFPSDPQHSNLLSPNHVRSNRLHSNRLHMATVAFTGAAGGVFGLPALALELPVSTTIMLRSIADIAHGEGEDIRERETQLACLEVFALGGPGPGDDAAESGYFGVRVGLAKAVSDAARYLTAQGAAAKSAPVLVNLVRQLAARFSIPVGQKAAAQAVPIIGAAGGALINALFIDHFQNMARGHFVVRRLERVYDPETVRAAYAEMPSHARQEDE